MPTIQVLDKHIAELIAAGEVVDRPCSVMKELVENSIDAGATVITTEIKNGGITFMRVTDNGCGIAPQDVPNAFLRHATSKVGSAEDLDKIGTLGFRGEALPSISAVSRMELLTRTRENAAGVQYCSEGGEMLSLEETGCPVGTTILVRDLFYNTPARMKFLKKDVVEGNAIAGILDKIALSHPEISLRLIRDGKETLHTPGDNQLRSAIYAVFGREFLAGLLPVDYTCDGVRVTGFVSKPSAARASRAMQHFFINGRTVRSRTAMAALEEAFQSSVMVGKFPACVLHIALSFESVDVNVHPSKMEVRFTDERPIFTAVYHAVKSALEQGDAPKEMQLPPQAKFKPENLYAQRETAQQTVLPEPVRPASPAQTRGESLSSLLNRFLGADTPPKTPTFLHDVGSSVRQMPVQKTPDICADDDAFFVPVKQEPSSVKPIAQTKTEPVDGTESPVENFLQMPAPVVIGEAFSTYIIAQCGDEVLLIDKHAAHERLLYEKLKAAKDDIAAQTLLTPQSVTLEKELYTAVLENREALQKLGFETEDFGSGTVLVRSVPLMLSGEDAAACVEEIAENLVNHKKELTTQRMDWIYHHVACRAAIKAGNFSSTEELVQLAAQLHRDPSVRYCPHGRPIYVALKKRELEKQFGRIQ